MSSHRRLPPAKRRGLAKHLPTYAWLAALGMLVGGMAALGVGGDSPQPAAAQPRATATTPAPDAPAPDAPEATPDESATTESAPAEAEPADVNRWRTELGYVATDAAGLTLYRFDKDTNEPSSSACEGACTDNWLPVLSDGSVEAGKGVHPELLGTVRRSDGTEQITINGWPVYTFLGDQEPGQLGGEGVLDLWHAITTKGHVAAKVQAHKAAQHSELQRERAPSGYGW